MLHSVQVTIDSLDWLGFLSLSFKNRSEEHTSELQSQEHISYAVFFSIDLDLIQQQQVCSAEYWGILHREQYLLGKTKLPGFL